MRFACRHEDLRLYAYGFLEPAEAAVVESHLLDCADCGKLLAELRDESLLVAFELSLDAGETSADPTPLVPPTPPRRSRLGRVVPIAVAAAAVLLVLAVLYSVLFERDRAPVPIAPEGPVVEGPGPEEPERDRNATAQADPNEELLKRLAELEEEVRRLAAARERGPLVPPEERPELAVEKHDWAGLASALSGVAPDIAKGRMPADPELLRAYLEALDALRDLAEAVGTPATVKEVARDPQTGPLLFAAALRQSWPDAPEQDIETATEVAKTAMEDYTDAVAIAETPAERAAAETKLTDTLTAEVRKLTETQGEPTVTPVTVPSSNSGTGDDEAESGGAIQIKPQDTTPVEPVEPAEPTNTNTESGQTTTVIRDVLSSAGIAPVKDRVYTGTPAKIVARILDGWQSDFALTKRQTAGLASLAEAWVRNYRSTLEATAPRVVAAFEARLGRGTAPAGVTLAEIKALRNALIALQVEAERRVLAMIPTSSSTTSVRTFFLFD